VTCKQSNISRLQKSTRCAKTNGIASMVITNIYLITIKALKITPYIEILHWKNEIDSICQNNIMKIVTIQSRPDRLTNLGIV
jgi:hypothetical protein